MKRPRQKLKPAGNTKQRGAESSRWAFMIVVWASPCIQSGFVLTTASSHHLANTNHIGQCCLCCRAWHSCYGIVFVVQCSCICPADPRSTYDIPSSMLWRFLNVVKSADAKFRAYVMLHGEQVHLGHYSDENQAARATDTAKIYLVRSYKQASLWQLLTVTCVWKHCLLPLFSLPYRIEPDLNPPARCGYVDLLLLCALACFVCRHKVGGDDSIFCNACNKACWATWPMWDASISVSSARHIGFWVASMIVVCVGAGHGQAEFP